MKTRNRYLPIIILLFLTTPLLAQSDLSQGIQLFEEDKLPEAKAFFESYVNDNGNSPASNYYLGRIYSAEADHEKAMHFLESALKLDDVNPQYHYWYAQACVDRIDDVGALKKMGLAKKARKACERAIELDPSYLDARNWLVGYYVNAPGIAGGSTEKAREQAVEIKKLSPVDGHYALALIYRREGNFEGAEKELLQYLALEPDDRGIQYQLGYLYVDMEQYENAFAQFENLIASDPQDWSAYYQVGRTAAVSGRNLERAEECLKEFLRQDAEESGLPESAAHWRLGMVYEHKQDIESAIAEYEASLQCDPNYDRAKEALKKLKAN